MNIKTIQEMIKSDEKFRDDYIAVCSVIYDYSSSYSTEEKRKKAERFLSTIHECMIDDTKHSHIVLEEGKDIFIYCKFIHELLPTKVNDFAIAGIFNFMTMWYQCFDLPNISEYWKKLNNY